jgi:4-hydroxy-tetrahydrodipicolinate synthase
VSIVKAALKLLGNDCGHVRAPGAWPLTERQETRLAQALKDWGLTTSMHVAA